MRENSRLLTILIPTRNRFGMLASLLEKLGGEDNGIVRVVVSDNCSDEIGYKKLSAICKSHVLDVSYQRHATEVTALENFVSLLKNVNTEFSCFLADDDHWETGALSKIASIMKIRRLDFSYADEWSSHDRATGIKQEYHKMHKLKDSRIDNLIEFIRYDDDPHVYGVYRTELLKEASQYFRQSWFLLPPDYNFNTSFEALAFVYLSSRETDFMPFRHSHGVGDKSTTPQVPRHILRKVWCKFNDTIAHLIHKTQLYVSIVLIMTRLGYGVIDSLRVLCAGSWVTIKSSPVATYIKNNI